MLDIDTAIKHCLEVAEQEECFINYPHSDIVLGDLDIESHKHYVAEQRQLAEWLTELLQRRERCAQYEVEQISNLEQYDMLSREYEILNERYKEAVRLLKAAVDDLNEVISTLHDNSQWRYTDESLKLIGGKDDNDITIKETQM